MINISISVVEKELLRTYSEFSTRRIATRRLPLITLVLEVSQLRLQAHDLRS